VRKMLLSLLAVTVLLGAAHLCPAQDETKTVVTVSFAGYDKLLSDIDAIGQLGGSPGLGQGLDMMLKLMTQGKGLAGVDAKQPWGAVVLTGDQRQFSVVGFIPVTDLKQLMELAKANPQLAEGIKLEAGVYEIQAGGPSLYVTSKDKWALLSNQKENLAKAPADPLKALGDLPARYDLAVRASVKNLPKDFRDQLLAQLRAGAEVGMQQMPSEGPEDYAMRLDLAKQTVQQLTALVNEMDEVLLGWNVDTKTNSTYLDLELTAQTGTKLADQFAQIKSGKTNFAGLLLPDAALTARSTGTLTDAQVAQANIALATLRKSSTEQLENLGLGEAQAKLASRLLGDVLDIVQKTVAAKKTDAALAVMLDPKAITFVAGTTIVDGAKLDKSVGQLLAEILKDKEAAKAIKISDETYQGVHLHALSMPTPDADLVQLVGDSLDLVVGIADDRVLAAIGRDAADTLKKAIDQSKTGADKEMPPMQIALVATPIAKFLAEFGDDEQVKATAQMLTGLLDKADGKDRITLTAKPISMGVAVRLEVEEGLLKALGSMGQMLTPPAGTTPPDGGNAAPPGG
jgi:hypothetical protein